MGKILKRLLVTTLALAIVMSGIIPGTEALKVQAKSLSEVNELDIIKAGDTIEFDRDFTVDIDGERQVYTSSNPWSNDDSGEYFVDEIDINGENPFVKLKSCTFSGYKITVFHDAAMDYGTNMNSGIPIELGSDTTISISELRDRIISSHIASGVVLSIFEDEIYKDRELTTTYNDNDVIDVSSGEISVWREGGTYSIKKEVYARLDFENVPTSGDCDTSDSSSDDKKEEESKPVEPPKTPETHYGMFQEDAIRRLNLAIENINKAVTNGTTNQTKKVELNTGVWVSFHKSVYEEIQKCTVPVSISFIYQGTRYVVTIPANADVLSLVDENGFCGFLNLGAHYGYDSIEKLW